MAEKRWNRRHRKRLSVRFGLGSANTFGFTEDISNDGLFIKSGMVQGGGRELLIEFELDGTPIKLVAVVQWAKRVPPAMLRMVKGGMGVRIVRFLEGESAYRALCAQLNARYES